MSFMDKVGKMQINLYQFYNMGMVCFLVIALANSYSMINNWALIDIGGKVSSIFGVIFNFGLVGFFSYLKNTLPGNTKAEEVPEEIDFNSMIEKLE